MPHRSDLVVSGRRVMKPRRSLVTILARCVTLLFLAVVASHWGFSRYGDAQLKRELDRFRAAGVPIDPSSFVGPAVADSDNAAVDLIAAGEVLERPSEVMDQFNRLEPALPLDPEEVQAIAAAVGYGRAELERVDRAMRKPAVRWPPTGEDIMALRRLPWSPAAYAVANLSRAAALAAHQRGDDAEALTHLRRIVFVADAVGQCADLVSQVSADGKRAWAADVAFQIAPGLRHSGVNGANWGAVRELITTFATTGDRHAAFVRGLEGARVQTWELVKAYADGRAELSWSRREADWSRRFVCAALRPFALNDARLLIARDTRMIEAVRSAESWPAVIRTFDDLDIPAEVRRNVYLHLPAALFAPSYERGIMRHYRSAAAQRIAATALATRAYATDHQGRLPARLDDLVPAYLPAVPLDPLAEDRRPLGYRNDPSNPLLYSVGEDGIDQGGSTRPINERWAHLITGDFDTLTEDAVVHLILPPRIRQD